MTATLSAADATAPTASPPPAVPTATPSASQETPAEVSSLPAPAVAQRTLLANIPEKAAGLLDSMNEARREAGLDPLVPHDGLAEVALARARDIVAKGYFDHYAPDGSSAFSEMSLRGIVYRLAGENLARNNYPEARTVRAAFEGLMASPGHRANILEPRFASVGVAAVQSGRMWVYVTVFTNEQ